LEKEKYNTMTNYTNSTLKSLFIFTLFILLINNSFAQSDDDSGKEKYNKIWYGINIGNIGIANRQFSTNLSLMGGYKINKSINVGAIVHGYYTYLWQRGNLPNYNIFHYGFGGLSNFKIYRNYFAQVEIDQMYITKINLLNGDKVVNPYLFTYIGGGYKYQSSGTWSLIITILYNVNPDSNQEFFPLDYRAAFVHNF